MLRKHGFPVHPGECREGWGGGACVQQGRRMAGVDQLWGMLEGLRACHWAGSVGTVVWVSLGGIVSCVCLLARVRVCAHMHAPALACPHFTRVSLKQWIENCSPGWQSSVALRMWLLSGCLQETEVWLLRKFIHNRPPVHLNGVARVCWFDEGSD